MAGHVVTDLHGIQAHVDAVYAGEAVDDRIRLIYGSNELDERHKWLWQNFLKSFCLYGSLEPLQGTLVDFGDGLTLKLNRRHEDLEGNELPGARVDHMGDLVIEGHWFRDGVGLARRGTKGEPLWPLILRDAPARGTGPWHNFQPQALALLKDIGLSWPR